VLRGLFDQLVGMREIARRDIKRAQIGYGENMDFPAELPEVTRHLMGGKQRHELSVMRQRVCHKLGVKPVLDYAALVFGAALAAWPPKNSAPPKQGKSGCAAANRARTSSFATGRTRTSDVYVAV
jgi:hypothetical protein